MSSVASIWIWPLDASFHLIVDRPKLSGEPVVVGVDVDLAGLEARSRSVQTTRPAC